MIGAPPSNRRAKTELVEMGAKVTIDPATLMNKDWN